MSIIVAPRIVVPSSPQSVACTVAIQENATQTVVVDAMSCTTKVIRLGIAQGADKTFVFQDAATVNYSAATEITFDVWDRATGASLLSKSMTGGDITLVSNNAYTLVVTNAESEAMTKGNKACETWVTTSIGKRRCVGTGTFRVEDTRKYD